jgi:adenylate cyclase
MSHVFISYARSTAKEAQAVAGALRGLGHEVWLDDEIPAHRAYADVIEERLKAAKAVVVIWSAEAVRSQWVQSEADRAREDGKLVQLKLDGARLPMPFDRIQCAEMMGWSGDLDAPGWRKVVASIASLAADTAPAEPLSTGGVQAPPAAPRGPSVCVLPFVNMSGDPEQEYFSDGVSEDIITDLSKVSALSVVARNTAFTFKGKPVKVTDIARELKISHVLEGSVRKAGGRVRITAQLIDGAAGDHVWAERYDRDLTDIFALQDEISQAIVAALKVKLLPREKEAIERRGTESVEAYNLYLMARQQFLAGNYGDARREEAMIRLTGRAVEIDSGYARAWALMAFAQNSLRYSRGKGGDDGLAAAERALQLDPGLAEAHAVKADHLGVHGRPAEAFAELEMALSLDPESLEANLAAGRLYSRDRRFDEAERYYAKTLALDDTSPGLAGMLVTLRTALGDRGGARRAAEITLERAEKVLAQDRNNGSAMAFGGISLAVLGERERARDWMDRALLVDPDNMLMRYNFACGLAAHLNDVEGAIRLLAQVIESATTSALVNTAKSDPDLDCLRDDPRFVAMLAVADARLVEDY